MDIAGNKEEIKTTYYREPVNAVPLAGFDQYVNVGQEFILDGRESLNSEIYKWSQVGGKDVLAGMDSSVPMLNVFAPESVGTLQFHLRVKESAFKDDAGNEPACYSLPALVRVHVFEDINNMVFVDGYAGDDANDGSMASPFKSLEHALWMSSSGFPKDIYVKSGDISQQQEGDAGLYDVSGWDMGIPAGVSLYGGYGDDWVRNVVSNKTRIRVNHKGIHFYDVSRDAALSGFEVFALAPDASEKNVFGVRVSGDGQAKFRITDNIINTDPVAGETGLGSATPGSAYGVHASSLSGLVLIDNSIKSGDGASGEKSVDGDKGEAGVVGKRPNAKYAGGEGDNIESFSGGSGGIPSADGLTCNNPEDGFGVNGGVAGDIDSPDGSDGEPGEDGIAGYDGVVRTHGAGMVDGTGMFVSVSSESGITGTPGLPGGGGGGSFCLPFSGVDIFGDPVTSFYDGAGGGAGGGGGSPGSGALGGVNGGSSVAVMLWQVANVRLEGNDIYSGEGGVGGQGGRGGEPGAGGGVAPEVYPRSFISEL